MQELIYKNYKDFRSDQEKALMEVMSLAQDDWQHKECQIKNLRIGEAKKAKLRRRPQIEILGMKVPRHAVSNLALSADLKLEDWVEEDKYGRELSSEEKQWRAARAACEPFFCSVTQLLVASQIAKPGVLRTEELELYINDCFVQATDGVLGSLGDAVDHAAGRDWPRIDSLLVRDVWVWLNSIGTLSDDLGTTPVGRAVNAFTHLLGRHFDLDCDLVNLLWAMIGLESLYGRGTTDLTHQLVEKTATFLGRPKGLEKDLKKMYGFRSKFVHGKASFPSAFFEADGLPKFEDFSGESSDASRLASAILIASLQQLVKRGWKNLSFSYSADDPPRPESSS